jgi:hypothetical protein
MPLPLAPVAVFALRASALAAVSYGVARLARARLAVGRTDQRAEAALDGLDDGLAAHVPKDAEGQRNLAWRFRRVVRGADGRGVEIDLGLIARARLRRV